MKIKNLNFLEKHIEKIAIGLSLVFFGIVMWAFVMGEPYTVQVVTRSGTQEVTPVHVEELIREQARKLEGDVSRTDLPFNKIPLPNWTEDFRNRMVGRFLPVDELPVPFNYPGLDRSLVMATAAVNPTRVVPTPPAAVALTPHADYGVLAPPSDPALQPKLLQLVGNVGEPADFRYVSIAADYDMEAWRTELKGQKVPSDQRLPEDWWRNRLYITDVTLQRQELDPVTGVWGQPVTIPSLPTRLSTYRDWQTKITAGEVPTLLQGIRESQDQITRPPFVEMERGIWTPPGSVQQLTQAQAQELVEIQQKLTQLRRRLPSASAGGATPAPAVPSVEVDPGSMPPGRQGAPGSSGGASAGTSLQSQVAELEARRDALLGIVRAELTDSNPSRAATPAQENIERPEPPPRPGQRPFPWRRGGGLHQGQGQPGPQGPAVVPVLPAIKIWAHDLTVEPGKTYRYRFSVSLLSPLFHNNDLPREQYNEYFNKLSLPSKPSEWSEPVTVDPLIYYFMTGQDPARRQATVDVFRIYNGIWMHKPFDVRPGDPIGGPVTMTYREQTQAVDMNTDALVVDINFPVASMGRSNDTSQTRMLLFKPARNAMEARVLGQDTLDPIHQRLLREIQIRSALASTASTPQ